MSDDPREALAETVKDKTDDEILAMLGDLGGVEQVLDMTFDGMKAALNPDKAQDCVVGYDLTGPDATYNYTVTIKDKACEVAKARAEGARVSLGLSVADYLRLISGNLDGMQAFMQGKLKLTGDMMFAAQIQQMFGV